MRTSASTATFDKNLFTIGPTGYVGINTTDPNCHLTVAGVANIHNGSPYANHKDDVLNSVKSYYVRLTDTEKKY